MQRKFGTVLAIVIGLALVLISGCGGGEPVETTTTTTSNTGNPGSTTTTFPRGEPYKLVYLTQPGRAQSGQKFLIQPMIAIQDTEDNIVSNSRLPVKLSLSAETAGSAILSGVVELKAINGQAMFSSCAIDVAGTGYVLVAHCDGLLDAYSEPFDVTE